MSLLAWDRWIGNNGNEPVYFQKRLLSWSWPSWRGNRWTLRLHKFVKADDPGCFHTHPAHAFRIILWGGYVEETYTTVDNNPKVWRFLHTCAPGFRGWVAPWMCHRVERLLNGRTSWSLWIVGPKVADIELHGEGWPDDFVPFGSSKRVRKAAPEYVIDRREYPVPAQGTGNEAKP